MTVGESMGPNGFVLDLADEGEGLDMERMNPLDQQVVVQLASMTEIFFMSLGPL